MVSESACADECAVSFPHLEHLTIKICTNDNNDNRKKDFTLQDAMSLLHANRRLQDLAIVAGGETTLDELLKTISKNTSFLNLRMAARITDVRMIDLERLINEHPLIEGLDFSGYQFTADAVVMLIQQLNSLKKFHFEDNSRSEYDHLVNRLDEKWQNNVSINGDQFDMTINR